jgi:hypothetical protein
MFTYTVAGLPELQANLKIIGSQAPRVVGAALYQEAELTMKQCKEEANVKTGALRDSGYVKEPVIDGQKVGVEMGFGGPAAPYAKYVHDGTPPHDIVAKNKKVLAVSIRHWKGTANPYGSGRLPCLSKDGNYVILGKRIHHPGYRGNPYLTGPVERNLPVFTTRIQTAVAAAANKQLHGGA